MLLQHPKLRLCKLQLGGCQAQLPPQCPYRGPRQLSLREKQCLLRSEDVRVVWAEHRAMLVAIRAPFMKIDVLTVHAQDGWRRPNEAQEQADQRVARWWQRLRDLVHRTRGGRPPNESEHDRHPWIIERLFHTIPS